MDLSPLLTGQVDLTTLALLIGGILLLSKFAPGLAPVLKSLLSKLGSVSVPTPPLAPAATSGDTLEAGIALCRALIREGKHEQAAQVMRDVLPGLLTCEKKEG